MFRKIFIAVLIIIVITSGISAQGKRSVLLLIDIQDFYFPGGRSELVSPVAAAEKAALLLSRFR